jgi:predicted dehydrogenase
MINIAFIGAGNMTSHHMKVFESIHSVAIAGIYSKTFEKANKLSSLYPTCKVYNSIEELFTMTKSDLVVISVPELATESVCLECFKYPWKCLVEKPIGYNLDVANIINEEALKYNREVYVALNRRHYASTRNLISELNKSNELRYIHIYDQENPNAALLSGQPELVVKNWMYANSIHLIDFVLLLGRGNIKNIENILPFTENYILAKIEFDSGDIVIYEGIWNAPAPWSVVVNTKAKRWEMRPIEKLFFQDLSTRQLQEFVLDDLDITFKPGLKVQAEEMIKVIRGEKNNMPKLKDALNTMKIIYKIYNN